MREIKFRVWDKELKEMCSVTDIQLWINYVHYSQKDGDIGKGNYPADVILMQYTGLKDKNGKEIYEGDILRYSNGEILGVAFDNKTAQFTTKTRWLWPIIDVCEIVGNIYDNPELLEVNNE